MLRSMTLGVLLLCGRAGAEEAKTAPGLHLTLEAKGQVDHRPTRLVALYVPAGEPASPFLPPGPFRAVWKADLPLDLKGDYTFSVEGRGKVTLVLNGTPLLEGAGDDLRKTAPRKVELKRANRLEVHYESPAQGDALLRVFWESEEFYREPLGLGVVAHDPAEAALARGTRLREGRDLFAQFLCARCHAADLKGMPELERDAPSLKEIGARLQPEWMARWVQHPQALRPSATMPRLLGDAASGLDGKLDPAARDLAAYLASLGKAPPGKVDGSEKTVAAGTRLFVNLGCVACHTHPGKDDYADDEQRRLPLRDVAAKYHPAALKAFLRKPDEHYSWVRMPDFQLSATEAEQLAGYLFSVKPRPLAEAGLPGARPERGPELVRTLGCLNCHALTAGPPEGSTLKSPSLEKLDPKRGCLSAEAGKWPRYGLGEGQRRALAECLAGGREVFARDTAAEFAIRQRASLRCTSCHKMDGADDPWSALKEEAAGLLTDLPEAEPEKDAAKYPAEQVRPPLTWAGEKLKPEWTTLLIGGKLKYKPRPWLRARMPAFPRRAELLARGMALEHGYPAVSPADPKPDEKLAEVGRNLASKARWGCVSCHDVGKVEAVGVFEAPGVNFMHVRERMRREFFDRWLWSPLRVEPGTKMPSVYMIGQKSQLKDVLDGDPQRQIDALWNYFLMGERIRVPEQ